MANQPAAAEQAVKRWNDESIAVPEGAAIVQGTTFAMLGDIPTWNITNGRLSDMTPYLLSASISKAFHWIPVDGIRPEQATYCLDGFVKSALYQVTVHRPDDLEDEKCRLAAIILGTARAVFTSTFGLGPGDLTPAETATAVLRATVPPAVTEAAQVSYTVLLAPDAPHVALLTGPLVITDSEREVMRVVIKAAPAIVPLQGVNLLSEGHHYLSDSSKSSYKAFAALERQVWAEAETKRALEGKMKDARDFAWHKAGHPIAIGLKERLATSMDIHDKLEKLELGSAAVRIPAVEGDVRAAGTYLNVMKAVDTVWKTMGGECDSDAISTRIEVLNRFPKTPEDNPVATPVGAPVPGGADIPIRTRKEALAELKRVLDRNTGVAAVAYGFYCGMMDDINQDSAGRSQDTLRSAFSLKKLLATAPAAYALGWNYYKDYRVMRATSRTAGNLSMPTYVTEV